MLHYCDFSKSKLRMIVAFNRPNFLPIIIFTTMRSIISLLWIGACGLLLAAYPNGPANNSTRSTGAPLSASSKEDTCTYCHNASTNYSVSATLEAIPTGGTAAVQAYVPGKTYQIKITPKSVTTPSGYGFQTTVIANKNYAAAGTFASPSTNTHLKTLSSRSYFEQSARTNSTPFTVTWTAPVVGTGTVTFYTSMLACNGNGKESGDQTYAFSAALTEQAATANEEDVPQSAYHLQIFPNPSNQEVSLFADAPSTLTVYNVLGQTVAQYTNSRVVQVNTNNWAKGVYVVRATSNGNTLTKTFVKE